MFRLHALVLVLAFLATIGLSGCDNPACALAGTCVHGSTGGGIGTEPASVPVNGEELLAAAPTLQNFFPSGATADPKTPIVLIFSESMANTNLNIAFELSAVGLGTIPLQAAVLMGDGHMITLFPLTDLQLGQEYAILYRTGVIVTDRTGQVVTQPADRTIGSFSVAATAPAAPVVVASWPIDMSTNESPTGEIDVVFSRPIDAATLVDASWVVTVGGVAPPNDPVAQPVSLSGLTTDTRAFRWRSTDSSGNAVSLGVNADVKLELSPTGNLIKDTGGVVLANQMIAFKTLTFTPPTGAAITSLPNDAIGIDQISGPANLAVRVDFADAQAGDRLGIFLFGKEPQGSVVVPVENLKTMALLREVALVAPFTSFTLVASELELARSTAPLVPRFTDGSVSFAFYVKRGSVVSPIRLLDVDATRSGTQSPVQDTTAPTLLGLSTSGNTVTSFRSDERGLSIVGRASEALRAVQVTTTLGNNDITPGEPAPVVGAHSSGLFLAAPVRLGVFTPAQMPLMYTVTAYDRALNATSAVTGLYRQIGQAANGAAGPFAAVAVEVFDSTTFAPVVGATVHSHENLAGSVSFVSSSTTDVRGQATLTPALLGETIVTVDARNLGYDLFTFDGITTDHVSIPLHPSALVASNAAGNVATTDTNFAAYQKAVADTRFPTPGETQLLSGTCSLSTSTQTLQCAFGPTSIRALEIGAQSAVVVLDPPSPFAYSALTYLKAFQLSLPLPPVDPGATQSNTLSTGTSLDASTLDAEERPIDVSPSVLSTVNYPTLSGAPRVRVEATSPGIPHDVTVGRGIAFNDSLPADTFAVRAAYPGSCDGVADVMSDKLGRFVTNGTIDDDLLLRIECVDTSGNRGGVRPRFSVASATLTPPAPPAPIASPFAVNLSGQSLDFTFADVIPDSAAEQGIYKVSLTDSTGLEWTIWRLDAADAAGPNAIANLPFVGVGSTLPLAAGALSIRVSAYAWPTFDSANFMWTDVEREFDLFAHTAISSATPP